MLRYVNGGTLPKSIRPGHVLMHNHVRHSRNMSCGDNGFRAWIDEKPPPGFKRCHCGWSSLPHYSRTPDYRCEPCSRLPGRQYVRGRYGRGLAGLLRGLDLYSP
jgi:hypothetical protein